MAELHLDGVFLLVKHYKLADLLNDEASGDDTLIAELLIGRVSIQYCRSGISIPGGNELENFKSSLLATYWLH